MTGYIHSLESLGTVDGPGVRAVVFASGCPYRCVYCHNPDTWKKMDGTPTEVGELVAKISRLYPYIKRGGVTFSGGEPCLQSEFFTELGEELKKDGIHIALDTSGAVTDESAMRLIDLCDLILLDIKFTSDEDYFKYVGGSLGGAMKILRHCEKTKKTVWIRHVVVPGLNDTDEDAKALSELLSGFSVIENVEFLPFRKLCLEKYKNLGITFPLENTREANDSDIERVMSAYYLK